MNCRPTTATSLASLSPLEQRNNHRSRSTVPLDTFKGEVSPLPAAAIRRDRSTVPPLSPLKRSRCPKEDSSSSSSSKTKTNKRASSSSMSSKIMTLDQFLLKQPTSHSDDQRRNEKTTLSASRSLDGGGCIGGGCGRSRTVALTKDILSDYREIMEDYPDSYHTRTGTAANKTGWDTSENSTDHTRSDRTTRSSVTTTTTTSSSAAPAAGAAALSSTTTTLAAQTPRPRGGIRCLGDSDVVLDEYNDIMHEYPDSYHTRTGTAESVTGW